APRCAHARHPLAPVDVVPLGRPRESAPLPTAPAGWPRRATRAVQRGIAPAAGAATHAAALIVPRPARLAGGVAFSGACLWLAVRQARAATCAQCRPAM